MGNPFYNFDNTKDQKICSIKKNGQYLGDVIYENGEFFTDSILGNNVYPNILALLFALQGWDLNLDEDIFWEF